MKKVFDVIIEKAKEVESNFLMLGFGVYSLFVLWAATAIVLKFIKMIITIVQIFAETPGATG